MAKTALQEMDDLLRAGKSAPLEGLTSRREALRKIPESSFTKEDLALRNSLLQRSGTLLADLVVAHTDSVISQQKLVVSQKSGMLASSTLDKTRNWEQKFLTDFTEVTEELITGLACGKILDQIAPADRPAEPGATTDEERGVQEAIAKLAVRGWSTAGLQRFVDWATYVASVKKDSQQFAEGIDGFNTNYLTALGNPGVRKAVLVYLRTCYSPPKAISR